jgi:DnaJ-domain-containing protein 1
MRVDPAELAACGGLHTTIATVARHADAAAEQRARGDWTGAIGSLRMQLLADSHHSSELARAARKALCILMPKAAEQEEQKLSLSGLPQQVDRPPQEPFEDALKLCTAAIKLLDHKDDLSEQQAHNMHYSRGWAALELGRLTEALQDASRALQIGFSTADKETIQALKDRIEALLDKENEAKDYYQILGVERTATLKEIRSAYRRLAKIWHPDKCDGSTQALKRWFDIVEAHEVLSEEQLRSMFNRGEDVGEEARCVVCLLAVLLGLAACLWLCLYLTRAHLRSVATSRSRIAISTRSHAISLAAEFTYCLNCVLLVVDFAP